MITRQFLAGMPYSGKSTFIVALRYCLVAQEAETSLTLVRFSEDEKHLNRLEERWAACEEVGRTKETTSLWVRFHVKDRITGAESELVLPDILGEAFRQPAATGRCRRTLYEVMEEADGVILFTNAARGNDDLLISDVSDLLAALDNGSEPASSSAVKRFDPENMPEEANLVELLQVINRRPLLPRRRRLAMIISAWDVVEEVDIRPEAWLSAKRPMLAQFLQYNLDLWDVQVFGVSAQGGVLPRDRATLQGLKPSLRVKVFGHDVAPHDLTAPIRWAMA
jgi:hypothetical protein